MKYKLIRIDSDMWSRCYFKCLETNKIIFFECNNNVASELVKLAIDSTKILVNFNAFFISKYEKVPGFNSDGSEQYANEIEDEWGTYENYQKARKEYIMNKIREYPNYLFLSEYGTPIWSNISEECDNLDYNFKTEFSSEYMKDLHNKKMYFKTFTNEIKKAEKSTFSWGLIDKNGKDILEENLTRKIKKEYHYEF